jgi:polysaccharide pyruvyl transferase WcaK-like protein
MVGGDNYSFDYGPPDRFFRINEIILEEGIPSIIWGASIGPFTQDPAYERQAASALKNVTLITARETETISYLDSIGVKDNVFHTADPALHLGPSPCTIPDELEALLTQGCIGLNLSPLLQKYFLAHEDPFEAWINTAAKIVDCLTRQVDLPVVLIPHVLYEFTSRSEYANNDWLLLSRVAEIVNKPEQVYLMGPHYNAAQSKWIISRLRLFAGARTHATIAAMSSNVPTICIGYSMKARGIAQDTYGNLRWLIDGQDCVTDVSLLADHMVDLIHQESAVRAHLEAANPLLKERAGAAAGALALALDDV